MKSSYRLFFTMVVLVFFSSCKGKAPVYSPSPEETAADERIFLKAQKSWGIFQKIQSDYFSCIEKIDMSLETSLLTEKLEECQMYLEKQVHNAGYTVEYYNSIIENK